MADVAFNCQVPNVPAVAWSGAPTLWKPCPALVNFSSPRNSSYPESILSS